mmetsp:Transcript_47468/g.143672  ORF Transcript_47468/g.143672 Transcript_47468/m.143672 type:complete len:90 (-) Transcript_47468:1251-1520(-)
MPASAEGRNHEIKEVKNGSTNPPKDTSAEGVKHRPPPPTKDSHDGPKLEVALVAPAVIVPTSGAGDGILPANSARPVHPDSPETQFMGK